MLKLGCIPNPMVGFLQDGGVLVVAAFLILIHNSCQPHGSGDAPCLPADVPDSNAHTKVRHISVMHPMTVSFPQVSPGNLCSGLVKLDVFVMVIFLHAGCCFWATAEEADLVWS